MDKKPEPKKQTPILELTLKAILALAITGAIGGTFTAMFMKVTDLLEFLVHILGGSIAAVIGIGLSAAVHGHSTSRKSLSKCFSIASLSVALGLGLGGTQYCRQYIEAKYSKEKEVTATAEAKKMSSQIEEARSKVEQKDKEIARLREIHESGGQIVSKYKEVPGYPDEIERLPTIGESYKAIKKIMDGLNSQDPLERKLTFGDLNIYKRAIGERIALFLPYILKNAESDDPEIAASCLKISYWILNHEDDYREIPKEKIAQLTSIIANCLKSPHPKVRMLAAEFTENLELPPQLVLANLLSLSTDPIDEVREAAASALVEYDDPQVDKRVEELLSDLNRNVRKSAYWKANKDVKKYAEKILSLLVSTEPQVFADAVDASLELDLDQAKVAASILEKLPTLNPTVALGVIHSVKTNTNEIGKPMKDMVISLSKMENIDGSVRSAIKDVKEKWGLND
ncbi:MAG: HEAT repeat domain-containing protein [Planctomycetota bacterium]|nr:HEAT repeat domain-containing protein [Planctomycetota bacterium]